MYSGIDFVAVGGDAIRGGRRQGFQKRVRHDLFDQASRAADVGVRKVDLRGDAPCSVGGPPEVWAVFPTCALLDRACEQQVVAIGQAHSTLSQLWSSRSCDSAGGAFGVGSPSDRKLIRATEP